MNEYWTPSGNHPIPDVGARVRGFLYEQDGRRHVIFPNDYQPATDKTAPQDAEAVTMLSRGGYTYLLPIELWAVFCLLVMVAPALVALVRHVMRRRAIKV